MENNNMHVEDGSGDRKYFTIIPNFVLNHSSANAQALYLQMKRIAGDGGTCEAGYRYFIKKLGIGKVAYAAALKYLLDHEWITFVGKKKIMTKGGLQEVNVYRVNDLWQINNSHYSKGGAKGDHLEGGAESNAKVGLKKPQGGAEMEQKKNIKKEHKEDTKISSKPLKDSTKKQVEGHKQKIRKKMGWGLSKV